MKKVKNRKIKNEKNDIEKEIATQLKSLINKSHESKSRETRLSEAELERDLTDSDSEKTEGSELENRPGVADLEEDLQVNLKDLEFHQFMQLPDSEGKAPVLERMALSAPRPIFVGGIPQGTQANAKEESSDDFKYLSSSPETNEPKYVESSAQIYKEPERLSFEEVGRKQTNVLTGQSQEAFFTQSAEARIESPTQEKVWRTDRFDFGNVGRRSPHERDETKYEKYKPRSQK